jgi:8-oxo-dGTP pyrophosphatase MutT (NUDIX family)
MRERLWPVSVKAVVVDSSRVLLCRNDRGAWELPGGRLEEGEDLHSCVQREVEEETGLTVRVVRILQAWSYEVLPGKRVVVIAFECRLTSEGVEPHVSAEHDAVSFIPLDDLDQIEVATGYRQAIGLTVVDNQ